MKKEKAPDVVIPIPLPFLAFSVSFMALLIIVLIFGGKAVHYNNRIQSATAHYVNKDYSAAYNELAGMEFKDEDEDFYNQVQTVMFVLRHYEAGKNLVTLDNYENALDSLLKGVSTFDKYQNQGRDLDCFDEMKEVLGWIDIELEKTYGLTESEARELNLLEDSLDYAFKVRVIAKEARENVQKSISNDAGSED